MTFWQAVTWETARASGIVAYLLFTGSVAVGLALTQHWQNARWPRIINAEMHNFLALVGLVFTALHVTAVLVDPFTHFGLGDVLLPFVSHYRTFWMGLGITGLYVGSAILISTWLRPRIGYTWWRRLHGLTLVGYLLVTVHGLGTGSDTRTWWGFVLYGGSIALIGYLLIQRLMEPATVRAQRHPVIASVVGVVLGGVVIWALVGPLQAGWNTRAGGTIASAAGMAQAATGDPYKAGFSDTFTGTLAQSGPDDNGNTTLTLHLTLATITGGTAQVQIQGQDDFGGLNATGGTVTLGTAAQTQLYTGTITTLDGRRAWRVQAQVSHGTDQLQVTIILNFTGDTTISGSIASGPATTATSV